MSLVDRFRAANLDLEVVERPLQDVENDDVFQMDVAVRGRRKGSAGQEVFRIWQGHPGNRLHVVGLDKDERQLVLMVHEPKRSIVRRLPNRTRQHNVNSHWINLRFPGAELVSVSDKTIVVRQNTPDDKRHYLCGRDERQLFIAQLPKGVSTVREAREALAPESLQQNDGKKIARQGEWFFVEATPDEVGQVKERLFLLERRVAVGPGGGRPHVVDEAVSLAFGSSRFVRGAVRHPDHRTIYLPTWHSVHLNREVRSSTADRVLWID